MDDDKKDTFAEIAEELCAMTQEEFDKALNESKEGDIAKALQYLWEIKCQH